MPLWRVFHHPSTFSSDQKQALAHDITALYHNIGLPKFYVNVFFIPLEAENFWIGGEPKRNFVRFAVEHIARTLGEPGTEKGDKARRAWMDKVNETLKPHITDREELQWELHILETPFDLWRIQGLEAPPAGSAAEQQWFADNKPMAWKL